MQVSEVDDHLAVAKMRGGERKKIVERPVRYFADKYDGLFLRKAG